MRRLTPIEQAAQAEFEYYGSTLTMNTALKIALLVLTAVIAMLGFALARTATAAAQQKPLIIRVNEVGRADALATKDFQYTPQAPEIRYFLTRFVTGFYGRHHATVRDQYVEAMYFLDRALFDRIDAQDRRSQWLPKFLSGTEDDATVTVTNVVIEDLVNQPYRARVEYTKTFTASTNGAEMKREKWATEVLFRFNPEVPNQLIPHNPLGLAVTYLGDAQAFTN